MQTLKLTKKYETYSEYKDSGVDWFAGIPKDWQVRKIKSFSKTLAGGTPATDNLLYWENGDIPWLPSGIVHDNVILENTKGKYITKLGLKESATKVIPEDSILVALTGATCANIAYLTFSATANQSVVAIVGNKNIAFSKFIYYALLANREQILTKRTGGAQSGINEQDVKRLYVTFPPIELQQKIANYLDEKTENIDQIIEKKQKLIELLREKRTAVINHAVVNTKGEVGKIKNYIIVNPTKKAVSETGLDDTVSFVPMEAISENGELTIQEKLYKDVKDGFTYFRNGDVVLAKITPCYENGKAGIMKGLKNDFGFGTTEFMVLRPSDKIMADYLYYVIFSDKFRKMGEVEMRGTAGQKRVTSSFVKNYEFTLPNIETQEKIVKELNRKTELFDLALGKVEKSIETLKEFKSSLISNVVTGKIKI